jgi:hypothetical protein
MRHVGLICALLLVANVGKSDDVKPSASKKHHSRQTPMNIEDMIRADEDPNYGQYLKERERQKNEERANSLSYLGQRQADEEARKKEERTYLREAREKAAREAAKTRKTGVYDPKTWIQTQEKYRREYLASIYKTREKIDSERIARTQRATSTERMPASSH